MHSAATRLLVGIVLLLITASGKAEPPRTELKTPPRINGRVVKDLLLSDSVFMGGGPGADPRLAGRGGASKAPGGPTFPGNYMIKPNRFVPVSEDPYYVYYQADGSFREGSGQPGGLRLSKTYPDQVYAYFGDARYPKIKLSCWQPLLPGDVRKIRVRYADEATKPR